jgi:hypothetical protein
MFIARCNILEHGDSGMMPDFTVSGSLQEAISFFDVLRSFGVQKKRSGRRCHEHGPAGYPAFEGCDGRRSRLLGVPRERLIPLVPAGLITGLFTAEFMPLRGRFAPAAARNPSLLQAT